MGQETNVILHDDLLSAQSAFYKIIGFFTQVNYNGYDTQHNQCIHKRDHKLFKNIPIQYFHTIANVRQAGASLQAASERLNIVVLMREEYDGTNDSV